MWQNYTLITAGFGGGYSSRALALQHSGRYWAGGRFSSFSLAFCSKIVRDVAGVTQSPVYLRTHCHLNEVIVNVTIYDRALRQFKSFSGVDVALDVTVDHGMWNFYLTRYFPALYNPQDGVLSGFSLNTTRHFAFYVQIASEGYVSTD